MVIIIHKRGTSFAQFFRPRARWIYHGTYSSYPRRPTWLRAQYISVAAYRRSFFLLSLLSTDVQANDAHAFLFLAASYGPGRYNSGFNYIHKVA